MGLGDIFKSLFGKPKKYEPPDVTFLEDTTSGVTHTIPITVNTPTQQIIIKNDDEYLVFDSKDAIPDDILEELQHLDDLGTVDTFSVIVDGNRQIYTSYEDIPEEVRKALEKADKKK